MRRQDRTLSLQLKRAPSVIRTEGIEHLVMLLAQVTAPERALAQAIGQALDGLRARNPQKCILYLGLCQRDSIGIAHGIRLVGQPQTATKLHPVSQPQCQLVDMFTGSQTLPAILVGNPFQLIQPEQLPAQFKQLAPAFRVDCGGFGLRLPHQYLQCTEMAGNGVQT